MKLIFIILTFLASHLQPKDTVFQAINKKNHKIFTIEKNSFVILETKDFEKYRGRLHFLNDSTVLIDTNKILVSEIYSIRQLNTKRFSYTGLFLFLPAITHFAIFLYMWYSDLSAFSSTFQFLFSLPFYFLFFKFAVLCFALAFYFYKFWRNFISSKYNFRIKIKDNNK